MARRHQRSPSHSLLSSAVPAVLRRAVTLTLSLIVFALSLTNGAHYVWCAPMARALVHPCCPAVHTPEQHGTPSVEPLCCEARQLASLPSVLLDHSPGPFVPPPVVIALALVALVLLSRLAPRAPPSLRSRRTHARAGPPIALYLHHCALLN